MVRDLDDQVIINGRQVRLLNDVVCSSCGRVDGLFIQYGARMICVDCVHKENGEDGDEP